MAFERSLWRFVHFRDTLSDRLIVAFEKSNYCIETFVLSSYGRLSRLESDWES